jgi:hypothetical protein
MPNPQYVAYKPAEPYFNLVRRALGELVDGEHFFDAPRATETERASVSSPWVLPEGRDLRPQDLRCRIPRPLAPAQRAVRPIVLPKPGFCGAWL